MILFDIRTDGCSSLVTAINDRLESVPGKEYIARFGRVGSARWWACFDRGEFPIKVLTGIVSYAGPRKDHFGELEDVVEFGGGGEAVVYDRQDQWAEYPIRVGDRIRLTRTEADLHSPSAEDRLLIDLRAEWFPSAGQPFV